MYGHRFDAHGFLGSGWLHASQREATDSATPKAGEVLFEAGLTLAITLAMADAAASPN